MTDFEDHLSAVVHAATPAAGPPYDEVLARRNRRRTRRRALVASAGTAALVAGIFGGAAALRPDSDPSSNAPVASPSATPEPTLDGVATTLPPVRPWDGEGAPPLTLELDGKLVDLEPWTSCFSTPAKGSDTIVSSGCFDGFPPPDPYDVGDRDAVAFSFPLKDWTFEATFTENGAKCPRSITVPVEQTSARTFLVEPAGLPGDYDVNVFGRGPEGDVITTFAWATPQAGPLPEPSGYLGLVSDDGDGYVAYPVEMGISDLAATPEEASVTVTVTAADGRSRTIGPIAAERRCSGAGTVYFREGEGGAAVPFELGPAPFTYRAEVILDGTRYVGTAVWPRDERRDEAPYTDLTFDPPLPEFAG